MLEIYITVNGEDSLLGGATVCAVAFEYGIPDSLKKFIRKQPVSSLIKPDVIDKVFEYKDYFTYKVNFLEPYQGIDKYRRIRTTAQNLALTIKYNSSADELKIYQSKNIGKSYDFAEVEVAKSLKAHAGLGISHAIAYFERRRNLSKLSLAYPEYEIMSHLGNRAPKHYEIILREGLSPLHDPTTMEYVARYIQTQINTYCDTDGYTHYKKYFKVLPHWWQVASDKYSLEEYFTDKEIVEMRRNLHWCKMFYLYRDAPIEKQVFELPNIRKFPRQFEKFLEETNPYADDE